ncbi:MAG: hypothetical protein QME06_08635 [Desulfobacterales bacterium]|nr:hypothetical protein [Desulfobacterales bacterium]
MIDQKNNKFAEKHQGKAQISTIIENEILKHSKDCKLTCLSAFQIADGLQISSAEVGMTVDLLNFRLTKCQLGLFGYQPQKKIIKAKEPEDRNLKKAIQDRLVEEKLTCISAWEIASKFNIQKMIVSSACEALNIKITKCQLGAF